MRLTTLRRYAIALLLGGPGSLPTRVRRLFLALVVIQSVSALVLLVGRSRPGEHGSTWLGLAVGAGLVCHAIHGYRRRGFPAWDWLVVAAGCSVVLWTTGYGVGTGLVIGLLGFRSLYGDTREAGLGATAAATGMLAVGEFRPPTSAAAAMTFGAPTIVVIAHLLADVAVRRDRAAARRDTIVAGATALMTATDRRAAVDAALSAGLGLDPHIRAAVVIVGKGASQLVLGLAERGNRPAERGNGPAARGGGQRVDLSAVLDATGLGTQVGAALVTGGPAVGFARAVGLPPVSALLVAPLCVAGDQFGLYALALDGAPPDDLVADVTTLAAQAAATLDRLLTVQRFWAVVGHSHDALLLATDDKIIRFANPAAQKLLSCSSADLCGRDFQTLLHPEDAAMVPDLGADPAQSPDAADVLVRMCRMRVLRDRPWAEVEIAIAHVAEGDEPPYLVINIRDVSERGRREVELRHAQKLASVGRLAAGIAHEINTPIHFVGENVRFLQQSFTDLIRLRESYLPVLDAVGHLDSFTGLLERARAAETDADLDFLTEEIPAAIAQSLEGIDRVASIVRAMKTFGHPSTEKAAANLNDAITSTLVIATNELKHVADVRTDLGALPPVHCHVGDINQVVLNLVVNAAHAITAAGRGRGVIGVATRHEGDQVVIEVSDTGTGIPPDVADKVFEPFFTTKPVGTGTGQGLALVRALVVDRQGGSIDFTTTPGEGTTFAVRLPVDEHREVAA